MALAEPGANLLLVVIAALTINVGVMAGVFHAPDTIGFADVTEATAGAASWWSSIGYVVGAVFALNLGRRGESQHGSACEIWRVCGISIDSFTVSD